MTTTRATRARPSASDGEEVLELQRAVKRMHTGRAREDEDEDEARAGAYAEVNAMLRALHFELARRLGKGTPAGETTVGDGATG